MEILGLFRYIRAVKINLEVFGGRLSAGIQTKRSGAVMQLSRKQLKEALDTVPMVQVLGKSPELTHKQREFARLVAQGETGAGAYRKAYNTKASKKTQGDNASRLRADDRIKAEIEAYQAANAALAYQTPQQLRQLVIHSLVKVLADPDTKDATKVQAAKVLGTVTEVAAFTERREVRTVKSSDDARAQLMAKLRDVMTIDATDATIKDADSLEREVSGDAMRDDVQLSSSDGNVTSETPPVLETAESESATPTAPIEVWSPSIPIHTIPHTQSSQKSTHPPSNPADDLEAELMETPPVGKTK